MLARSMFKAGSELWSILTTTRLHHHLTPVQAPISQLFHYQIPLPTHKHWPSIFSPHGFRSNQPKFGPSNTEQSPSALGKFPSQLPIFSPVPPPAACSEKGVGPCVFWNVNLSFRHRGEGAVQLTMDLREIMAKLVAIGERNMKGMDACTGDERACWPSGWGCQTGFGAR